MTVSVSEVIKLNEKLKDSGVKLHMRDACGGQAFYLEGENIKDAKKIIEDFFSSQRASVLYYDEKSFTVKGV